MALPPRPTASEAAWRAVSTAFGSLGRVCMSLDEDFRLLHASSLLDDLVGPGASERMLGQPVSRLLGEELFGPSGTLTQALRAGERREGWRAAILSEPVGSRLVSVTAAPVLPDPLGSCDARAAFIVVLRPADEDGESQSAPLTVGSLVTRSSAMGRVLRLVENLQQSEATVLITGESGTGKEVVARALHAHSPRRNGPFVAVNCAALPAGLLESELFGHVRGAFTGAVRDRVGRFEMAADGTLFLDEVAELPAALQVKLLRVLQERSFEPVGESTARSTNTRIIAATNRDLARAMREGAFREDLYYRLRVVPIELPPLRQRKEDVELLARALLARVNGRSGRALRLSPQALRVLIRYDWPGNVRELENCLDYVCAVCQGQTILPEDLPAEMTTAAERRSVASEPPEPDSVPAGASDERERIRDALDTHRWVREEAAQALGMSRTTLWRKMRELGLIR